MHHYIRILSFLEIHRADRRDETFAQGEQGWAIFFFDLEHPDPLQGKLWR